MFILFSPLTLLHNHFARMGGLGQGRSLNLPLPHFSFVAHLHYHHHSHHHQHYCGIVVYSFCFVVIHKRLLCGWGSEELRIPLAVCFSIAGNL